MTGSKAAGEDEATPWQQLAESLSNVGVAWRVAGESQAQPGDESIPATRQLREDEANELARAGYEAAEALAGIATVLSRQEGATQAWDSAQNAQREVWRHWRVAMDARLPDEETPP